MDLEDKIIIDDDVEVKCKDANINQNSNYSAQQNVYTNSNIQKTNVLSLAFSKKYLALSLSTISILLALFMKFLTHCGVFSRVFYGIWFFLTASLAGTAFVLNIINFAKNKKIDFNVSSVISFLAIIILFLV
ncbi:MAG: hypothetical protein ACI4TI_03945 [Christensenellales bacterium]